MGAKERTNGRRIAKAVALASLMGVATLVVITIALECIRHLEYWYGENVAVVSVVGVVVVCAATLLGALLPERKKTMRGRAREVVAISTDGKVAARFHTITETARHMRVSKNTICNRCNEMEKLKGYRLMYAGDWSPWGDYRHSGGERRRKRYKRVSYVLSEKGRKKKSDDAKINKPWLHRKVRRILCADTGVIFPSRREAAEWLNVDPRRLSSSISEHRRIKGYTMVYAP